MRRVLQKRSSENRSEGRKLRRRRVDLLIGNAAQLVTCAEDNVIDDGSVAVDSGRIVAVGRTARLKRRFDPEETIDATGQLVAPGFVDCHTHPIFGGSREDELDMKLHGRTYMEILRSGGGILRTVRDTRASTREELLRRSSEILDVMLVHGTTTVEAKSGYGLTVADELKILQVAQDLRLSHPIDIVPTFMGAHIVPPEYQQEPNEYVKLIVDDMLPRISKEHLAEFCDVFCDDGAFSVEQSRRILDAATALDMRPKIHANEFMDIGATKLAVEIRAISADHLLCTDEVDLINLAGSGVVPVFLPGTSMALMENRYANAGALVSRGLRFALASDFNPNCPVENLQFILTLACYAMQVPLLQALEAITLDGAKAVGRQMEIGSIVEGKRADIVILNAPNYRFLMQHLGVNLVDKVVKSGSVVVRDGRLTRNKCRSQDALEGEDSDR